MVESFTTCWWSEHAVQEHDGLDVMMSLKQVRAAIFQPRIVEDRYNSLALNSP
jgi:hypothetical protein